MNKYTYILLKINLETGDVEMDNKTLNGKDMNKDFEKEMNKVYEILKLNQKENKQNKKVNFNFTNTPKFGFYDVSKKSYLDNGTGDRTEIRYYGRF